jgi:DNA-binding transcriptional LysR family regulator
MEMHQIRYFLAVSETLSFTRAAERCRVSQPTLTAAIQKLEKELGGPLLLRERGGSKLTPLGRSILPRLRRIENEQHSVSLIAENHRKLKQVPLRVGVLRTLGPSRLCAELATFRAAAPGVEVELHFGSREDLLRGLEEAEVDVLLSTLVSTHTPPDWCVVSSLYEERYVVVLPPGHRLVEHESISLGDVAEEAYIDRTCCELRDQVVSLCTSRQVALYASYRTEREEWVQHLVAEGVGIAFMPEHSVMPGLGVVRPLVDPDLRRTVCLIRSADRNLPPAAKLLWRTLLADKRSASPGA